VSVSDAGLLLEQFREVPLPIPSMPLARQAGSLLPLAAATDGKCLPMAFMLSPAPAAPSNSAALLQDPKGSSQDKPLAYSGLPQMLQKAPPHASALQHPLAYSALPEMLQGLNTPAELEVKPQQTIAQAAAFPDIEPSPIGFTQSAERGSAGERVEHYGMLATPSSTTPASLKSGLPLLAVQVGVGQPDWDQAVGERIQWMINKHIQQAEIKLNPPNLGPLEVRVSLQHDQANVNFLVAQAPTREALEAALPRLREMFGEASLNLINVDVEQRQGSGQHSAQARGFTAQINPDGSPSAEIASSAAVPTSKISTVGMVDDYA
jgi:hypothetical protein